MAVVEYAYDAWGNVLSISGSMATTLGTLNPLTYRGYVYDHETGLYYVSSRYYNPAWSRFLNADVLISTGQGLLGNNMIAYCRNNPVSRKDVSGTNDVDCFDSDADPSDDDEEFAGGRMGGGGNPSVNSGGWGAAPRYPENPDDFNPNGLVRKDYVDRGTGKNGGITKWEIPGTKIAVFEWNEDYRKGSHYHAMNIELGNTHINHLYANDIIEEPWRSIYF